MWSYHGSKANVIDFYPPPKYGKIIEPFAGSARYALKYFDRDVLIVDKYEVVIKIWKWLQMCSPGDILKLPRMKEGQHVDDLNFDCDEAKWLVGFLIGFLTATPRKTATVRMTQRPNASNFTIKKIAESLFKIRHWEIRQGCYSEIANEAATWFIDPPYQHKGQYYKHSNKNIDFPRLGDWSRERLGQVIVCEMTGADWMPFFPIASHHTINKWQHEVFWTNQETSYNVTQQKLFG